ncbi:dolichol-phosphate mannosyltransferase [Thioclava sp. SK-1]|uniref:glycosyltransferase family 2 protein n=1 Tax=Thioclava sp. SK-1 TaxID=1889770 RepID=UPI00082701B0|nr:glycosyltransferase family 2 protein [Thioclava sp. SK-1]OCX59699.1 dolichol-phosphate mannosyltransferase [Thioclava sp. SK-1]
MPDVSPQVSVVIPAKNEAENILPLLDEIHAACAPVCAYEVIVVDDGSDDGMGAILEKRMSIQPQLRVLRNDVSGGQSAAVHSGTLAARAPIICTLDGDGQNPPCELPKLMAPLQVEGARGLVAGQRVGRQDTLSKRYASKFANAVRAKVLQDGTRDTGCGLKAFRRDEFLTLPYFDHMHRYLPALFAREGLAVTLVDVSHRSRGGGASKYTNWQRGLVGIVDLAGVAWLLRRRKKQCPTEVIRSRQTQEV